jgi:hypothetical protein
MNQRWRRTLRKGPQVLPTLSTALFSALLLVLTSCGSANDAAVFNSGRTDVESIQASFRESVLSAFDADEQDELIIAEVGDSPAQGGSRNESKETLAWRATVVEPWEGLDPDKVNQACELFFSGLIDPNSGLGDAFKASRERFISEGKVIHSLTDVRMVADNRKTIQIPTPEASSALFICESTVVLKLANQNLSAPQTLRFSWNYYLAGQEIKWTFSFSFRAK